MEFSRLTVSSEPIIKSILLDARVLFCNNASKVFTWSMPHCNSQTEILQSLIFFLFMLIFSLHKSSKMFLFGCVIFCWGTPSSSNVQSWSINLSDSTRERAPNEAIAIPVKPLPLPSSSIFLLTISDLFCSKYRTSSSAAGQIFPPMALRPPSGSSMNERLLPPTKNSCKKEKKGLKDLKRLCYNIDRINETKRAFLVEKIFLEAKFTNKLLPRWTRVKQLRIIQKRIIRNSSIDNICNIMCYNKYL